MYDTSGDPKLSTIRPMSYARTDVFVICFSLVDLFTFDSVESHWVPEIKIHSPRTPIILVGTKLDLRSDKEFLGNNNSIRSVQYIEVRKYQTQCS